MDNLFWYLLWAFLAVGLVMLIRFIRLYLVSEAVMMPTLLDDPKIKEAARRIGVAQWEKLMKERGERI